MTDLSRLFIGDPKWNRPTHGANRCVILAARSCCICVPNNATRVVIEMWGQGGGGVPGRCCSWSCVGGQGGSYAYKVWEGDDSPASTGQCMFFCGCVCACDCRTYCSMQGHPGQFARLRNCNTTPSAPIGGWVGCVEGGSAGVRRQDNSSYVCSGCGNNYNIGYDTDCISAKVATAPEFYSISNCMSTAQSSSCRGGSMSCCTGAACYCATGLCSATCTGFQHRVNEVCVVVASAGGSSFKTFDEIFEPRSCTCFDTYRLGACGWSKGNPLLGYNGTWNHCDWGVGGAAYAGGRQEKRNSSMGNFAYCGFAGNMPGGGGRSSSSCGGGCCCGSIGGAGVILVSWDT